jgi:hypothetical protein
MIFLTMWQTKHLVKMDRSPSKWPKLNEINHIQSWLGFSQIDHFDLTLSQINHIDLGT